MSTPSITTPETSPAPVIEPPTAPEAQGGTPKAPEVKKSLEDSLADLDGATRTFVLGEVAAARSEAKNLRDRLRQAEPKITEYDRLVAASKTAEERAQEVAQAAESRAATALQRVARAEVKAALATVTDDPDSIIKHLDLSKFVDSDGEIDSAAIDELRTDYASRFAAAGAPRAPKPDPSQASGANGKSTASPADQFASFIQQQTRRT